MSNIAPQDHDALNGSGGPWYALETCIRTRILPELNELHLIVGCIVSDSVNYETLINKKGKTDIAVPDKFYQVIIYHDRLKDEHVTAAFLFPHVRDRKDLPFGNDLAGYLVPVDSVETVTGLDFFHDLENVEENKIEKSDNRAFWNQFILRVN